MLFSSVVHRIYLLSLQCVPAEHDFDRRSYLIHFAHCARNTYFEESSNYDTSGNWLQHVFRGVPNR